MRNGLQWWRRITNDGAVKPELSQHVHHSNDGKYDYRRHPHCDGDSNRLLGVTRAAGRAVTECRDGNYLRDAYGYGHATGLHGHGFEQRGLYDGDGQYHGQPGCPSALSYAQASITAIVGIAITTDTPAVTGTVSSFSVSPALPAGLSIDSTTGAISGTPTAVSAKAAYTVTAANAGGNTSVQVNITVVKGPTSLLDLGHVGTVTNLRFDGTNVISSDSNGRWILWDYVTGNQITSGNGAAAKNSLGYANTYAVDVAGQIAAVYDGTNINLYSSSAGSLIGTVPGGSWWKLAADGSYIAVGSTTALTVYSATAAQEFTRAGDYSKAVVFAAPGQVQVAMGAAGQNVIENLAVPSGSSTISAPFSGVFSSWFLDGQRFLTTLLTTVWTYSADGVQQASVTLPAGTYTGQGNWIWTVSPGSTDPSQPGTLQIYAIGSSTPAQTFTTANALPGSTIPSGLEIAYRSGVMQMTVVDLSGATPAKTDYPGMPIVPLGAFAATSASDWLVSSEVAENANAETGGGTILDGASLSGTPRFLDYGAALSIASGGNTVAIATESGRILIYDASGPTKIGEIPLLASKLALSADGSILAAAETGVFHLDQLDRTVRFYSLPSMSLIGSIDSTANCNSTPYIGDFTLSGSGTEIGLLLESTDCNHLTIAAEVSHIDGSNNLALATPQDVSAGPFFAPLLSPDGTLGALFFTEGTGLFSTTYKNGLVVSTLQLASPEGWIDNNDLLTATYSFSDPHSDIASFSGSTIYNASGSVVSTFTTKQLPEMDQFLTYAPPQFFGPGSVYNPATNAIYSLTTGSLTFQAPEIPVTSLGFGGAVAGSDIIYESIPNHALMIEPFQ
jgi:hypothetical protein